MDRPGFTDKSRTGVKLLTRSESGLFSARFCYLQASTCQSVCGPSIHSNSPSSHRESQKGSGEKQASGVSFCQEHPVQLCYSPHREVGMEKQKPEPSDTNSQLLQECETGALGILDLIQTLVWLPHHLIT